jgi:predicted hotdog family 3-hydroxylacyl-ACP dehydratase
MIFPAIHTLVPHAKPMLLLDRVIAADAESLTAEIIIRADSLFFNKQINGVAAWVGVEYMAQTVAAYAGYVAQQNNEAVKVGFLLGTRRYECQRPFFALNSVLHIYAKCILQADNGLGSFECMIQNEETQLASAIINAFQPDNLEQFLTSNKV